MKRRDFLIQTGLAGMALPGLSWAAGQPCPPPSLSASGGTSANTGCGSGSVGAMPALTLVSGVGSGTHAWTFGQPFVKGAVRPGSIRAQSGVSAFQAEVRNLWDDGTVKFAVLSGISIFTGSTVNVVLGTAGTLTGGSAVAEPDVQASVQFSAPAATVQLATARTNGSMAWTKATAHRVRQILGPVMSEFHYYSPVPGDNHLAVWWYVRAYSTGHVEVETVVENGWIMVASPSQKNYTATVIVAGTQRYSGSVAQYHHTRWSRADWTANPQIVPRHDGAYLRATKLLPNYGPWDSPTSEAWTGSLYYGAPINNENPAPLDRGNLPASMGAPGYSEHIGLLPRWDALYITSEDARAYRSVIGNARCSGRWSIHYRDETTGRPFRVSAPLGNASYANSLSFASNSSTEDYGAYQGGVQMPSTAGQSYNPYTTTHSPAPTYLAYLVSGRWQFMEQSQFQTNQHWLRFPDNSPGTRRDGAKGIVGANLGAETRAHAWHTRTLGMAACITPDPSTGLDGGLQSDYRYMIEQNAAYNRNLYVGGAWDNGLRSFYSGHGTDSSRPWMMDFWVAAIGFVADLEVVSNPSDINALRNWFYGHVVGRFGATTSTFCWQDAAQYDPRICVPGATDDRPYNYFASWGDMYAANGIGASCDVNGDLRGAYADENGTVISYWANLQPALAMAVDHGAGGASAAWGRYSVAGNYRRNLSSAAQDGGVHNNPTWAIVPRSM